MTPLASLAPSEGRTRVLAIVGTRPETVKMFSPVQVMREQSDLFEVFLCTSGQHSELLRDALDTFGLDTDEDLASMRHDQRPSDVVWMIGEWISDLARRLQPDVLLVQGDTATALAGGLAGYYSSIPVAHVEAGLRTYDNRAPWPEEGNRRMLGAISDLHFAPTELSAGNLLREGIPPASIHVTGNTGVDALHWALSRPAVPDQDCGFHRRVLVTCHRRESIPDGLEAITRAVRVLALRYPLTRFQFVLHPSPSVQRIVREAFASGCPGNVELLGPCGYVPFVQMLSAAHVVLTDSGGIQEEAPVLGTPVLVINQRTARQEALAAGTARIVGTRSRAIVEAAAEILDDPHRHSDMAVRHDAYGDGRAGERIAAVLASFGANRRRGVVEDDGVLA